MKILIVGPANSARSQMAEGLFRFGCGARWEVASAGVLPSAVSPEAISVMREIGIDISSHLSKSLDEFAGSNFDYLVTVCDTAVDVPFFQPRPSAFTGVLRTRQLWRETAKSAWLPFAGSATR